MTNELSNKIFTLLDLEQFDNARQLVYSELNNNIDTKEQLLLHANLYGFLIDIGSESNSENDLKPAISFYEQNKDALLSIIQPASYYYNLANAYQALSKVYFSKQKGVPSIEIIKTTLQPAINLYWQAYKNTIGNSPLESQILINLSNSLAKAGRLIEASQFLDVILEKIPDYPQALISRAENLWWISLVTNCEVTVALYSHIYKAYNDGIRTNKLPQTILNKAFEGMYSAKEKIEEYNFNIAEIEKELQESALEFNKLTPYRKFCLSHFISLNEHAIYCPCNAAKIDDIQIGVTFGKFEGELVPRLELLLNRLKSEFALARWLYYQAEEDDTNEIAFDMRFSDLLDEEIISSKTEMLRTSYRTCYGILDKIALGICKLYDLSADNESIHFESFWKNKWDKVSNIKNMHLSALYSIASDLNTKNGELKHFKNWRNKLEHKLLILKDNSTDHIDYLNVFRDTDFIAVADIDIFRNNTLHLLQLTRAAIFSYVYCVRLQTISPLEEGDENRSFKIHFK